MEPEVIVNLWLFVGERTRLIYELAIRPYMMAGSDDDKFKLLNALAPSDFQFARRFKLPDRYTVEFEGTKHKGLTAASGVGPVYEGVDPFQEAFDVTARVAHGGTMRRAAPMVIVADGVASRRLATTGF